HIATGSVAMMLFHLPLRPLLLWLMVMAGAVFTASAAEKVNITTADAAQTEAALSGIGPAKAEAIVAHRKESGPFKRRDGLALVRGIGLRPGERNRDLISVGGAPARAAAAGRAPAARPAPANPVARR